MLKNLTKVLAVVLLLALLVPAATVALAQDKTVTCEQDYSVQAQDWLSKLADKYYGDKLAYSAIFDATNAMAKTDKSYATIANADVIEPGSRIVAMSFCEPRS